MTDKNIDVGMDTSASTKAIAELNRYFWMMGESIESVAVKTSNFNKIGNVSDTILKVLTASGREFNVPLVIMRRELSQTAISAEITSAKFVGMAKGFDATAKSAKLTTSEIRAFEKELVDLAFGEEKLTEKREANHKRAAKMAASNLKAGWSEKVATGVTTSEDTGKFERLANAIPKAISAGQYSLKTFSHVLETLGKDEAAYFTGSQARAANHARKLLALTTDIDKRVEKSKQSVSKTQQITDSTLIGSELKTAWGTAKGLGANAEDAAKFGKIANALQQDILTGKISLEQYHRVALKYVEDERAYFTGSDAIAANHAQKLNSLFSSLDKRNTPKSLKSKAAISAIDLKQLTDIVPISSDLNPVENNLIDLSLAKLRRISASGKITEQRMLEIGRAIQDNLATSFTDTRAETAAAQEFRKIEMVSQRAVERMAEEQKKANKENLVADRAKLAKAMATPEFLATGGGKFANISELMKGASEQKLATLQGAFQSFYRSIATGKTDLASAKIAFKELGESTAQTTGPVGVARTGLLNLQKAVKGLAPSMQEFLLSWQSAFRILAVQTIHMAFRQLMFAATQSIQVFTQLNLKIVETQSISSSAAMSTSKWTSELVKLSNSFGFDVMDTAKAAYQTLSNSAGDGANAINFMAQAAQFARATNVSLTEAVDVGTAAMNSYRDSGYSSNEVFAMLFETIKIGRLRASELANTIGPLLVMGKTVGANLPEVLGALTTLTQKGISAPVGETQIRNVLMALEKPSKEFQKIIGGWGFTSGTAALHVLGLVGVLQKLKEEVDQFGDDRIGQIFPDIRKITGIEGLIQDIPKTTKKIEQVSGNGIDYQNAVDLGTNSLGAQMQKQMEEVKNAFLGNFSENVVRLIVNVSEAFGGLGTVLKGLLIPLELITVSLTTFYLASKFIPFATIAVNGLKAAFQFLSGAEMVAAAGAVTLNAALGIVTALVATGITIWAMWGSTGDSAVEKMGQGLATLNELSLKAASDNLDLYTRSLQKAREEHEKVTQTGHKMAEELAAIHDIKFSYNKKERGDGSATDALRELIHPTKDLETDPGKIADDLIAKVEKAETKLKAFEKKKDHFALERLKENIDSLPTSGPIEEKDISAFIPLGDITTHAQKHGKDFDKLTETIKVTANGARRVVQQTANDTDELVKRHIGNVSKIYKNVTVETEKASTVLKNSHSQVKQAMDDMTIHGTMATFKIFDYDNVDQTEKRIELIKDLIADLKTASIKAFDEDNFEKAEEKLNEIKLLYEKLQGKNPVETVNQMIDGLKERLGEVGLIGAPTSVINEKLKNDITAAFASLQSNMEKGNFEGAKENQNEIKSKLAKITSTEERYSEELKKIGINYKAGDFEQNFIQKNLAALEGPGRALAKAALDEKNKALDMEKQKLAYAKQVKDEASNVTKIVTNIAAIVAKNSAIETLSKEKDQKQREQEEKEKVNKGNITKNNEDIAEGRLTQDVAIKAIMSKFRMAGLDTDERVLALQQSGIALEGIVAKSDALSKKITEEQKGKSTPLQRKELEDLQAQADVWRSDILARGQELMDPRIVMKMFGSEAVSFSAAEKEAVNAGVKAAIEMKTLREASIDLLQTQKELENAQLVIYDEEKTALEKIKTLHQEINTLVKENKDSFEKAGVKTSSAKEDAKKLADGLVEPGEVSSVDTSNKAAEKLHKDGSLKSQNPVPKTTVRDMELFGDLGFINSVSDFVNNSPSEFTHTTHQIRNPRRGTDGSMIPNNSIIITEATEKLVKELGNQIIHAGGHGFKGHFTGESVGELKEITVPTLGKPETRSIKSGTDDKTSMINNNTININGVNKDARELASEVVRYIIRGFRSGEVRDFNSYTQSQTVVG